MVWVGDAESWQNGWETHTNGDGESQHWWGTKAPFTIRGQELLWGQPFQAEDTNEFTGERTTFLPLGNTTPDYTISWSNTVTWKNFSAFGLLRSVQGFSVYNMPLQWATFQDYSGIMDQSGVSEDQQKPIGYYSTLYNASGLAPSSVFVEDASFIKLQELRVAYRAGPEFLGHVPLARGFSALTVSLTGHNLWTSTDYDGYDPDVGQVGGGPGSAALMRTDGFRHPPFRTFALGLELTF